MLHDGSTPLHHFWMKLHPLRHAFKGFLSSAARDFVKTELTQIEFGCEILFVYRP